MALALLALTGSIFVGYSLGQFLYPEATARFYRRLQANWHRRSGLGPRVVVTGGLGFIGSHVVELLVSEGYRVYIFDDQSTGHNLNPNAELVIGDIRNPTDLSRLPATVDHVVHLAAAISVAESMSQPAKYQAINVDGSRNVLAWAAEHGARSVVSASSAAVYGTPQRLPLDEEAPKAPLSPYASTKLTMESLHQEFAVERHRLPSAVCLRFFNVYGPRQDPRSQYSGVISKFLDQAATEGRQITIQGDGLNTRDFVYVGDVARAVLAAMRSTKPGFHVYNVGTEKRVTIRELAETVRQVTGSDHRIELGPPRPGDIQHSLSSTSRIRSELDWSPRLSLADGLLRTWSWYNSGH
jgi:UDP-glucose 4-epimerase